MRVRKLAAITAMTLLVTAGCGSKPKATNPDDQKACAGLNAAYKELQKPLSDVMTGKATTGDKTAIADGASSLRLLADTATEPLKSALNNAANAADRVADGNVTLADDDVVSKAYTTLGKEVGKQCGNAG